LRKRNVLKTLQVCAFASYEVKFFSRTVRDNMQSDNCNNLQESRTSGSSWRSTGVILDSDWREIVTWWHRDMTCIKSHLLLR